MTEIEEDYFSSSYSEAHRAIGFPALFYKSTKTKDKFNQVFVTLSAASASVYAVFVQDEEKDADLVSELTTEGSVKTKAVIKVVRKELVDAGIPKVELKDVVELTINGESKKFVVTGFSSKNELPNLFYRLKITEMDDVNVREIYG